MTDKLRESIKAAIYGHNELAVALSQIAKGRDDCGRPLGGETARRLARDVMTDLGLDWTHVLKVREEMAIASARAVVESIKTACPYFSFTPGQSRCTYPECFTGSECGAGKPK